MRETCSLTKANLPIARAGLHTIGSCIKLLQCVAHSTSPGLLPRPGQQVAPICRIPKHRGGLASCLGIGVCYLWGPMVQGIVARKQALWPQPSTKSHSLTVCWSVVWSAGCSVEGERKETLLDSFRSCKIVPHPCIPVWVICLKAHRKKDGEFTRNE